MRRRCSVLACCILAVLAAGCAHRGVEPVATGWTEKGLASWYGEPYHGRRAASGEIYDMHQMTAAHRTLPFGTRVRVTRRDTGASVIVRINDRGPFVKGRIIDLSYAAAKKVGLVADGIAPVKLEVVGREDPGPPAHGETTGGAGCFWVQVGAFGDPGNARRAKDRLVSQGERALIIEGPGGTHRVRVGPFEDGKAAKKARKRLRRQWPSAAVVPCG